MDTLASSAGHLRCGGGEEELEQDIAETVQVVEGEHGQHREGAARAPAHRVLHLLLRQARGGGREAQVDQAHRETLRLVLLAGGQQEGRGAERAVHHPLAVQVRQHLLVTVTCSRS